MKENFALVTHGIRQLVVAAGGFPKGRFLSGRHNDVRTRTNLIQYYRRIITQMSTVIGVQKHKLLRL